MGFVSHACSVGINTTSIDEFSIGDRVRFHDEVTGVKGEGIIESFSQMGYEPTIWYRDEDSKLRTVHLGWCTKI